MPLIFTRSQVVLQMVLFFLVLLFKYDPLSSGHNRRQILVEPTTLFLHVVSHIDFGNKLPISLVVKLFLFDGRITYDLLVHYWFFSKVDLGVPHRVIIPILIYAAQTSCVEVRLCSKCVWVSCTLSYVLPRILNFYLVPS